MPIDLSRISTDFRKEYRGVRMQQGRVLTDDDFNEAAALEAEDARRTRLHAIGAYGSPDQGFLPKDFTTPSGKVSFTLAAGTLYLGGHRLELRQDQAFEYQTNWLNFDPATELPSIPTPGQTRRDLVWIEAWQQSVSAVEDAELFEVALGGADTGVRQRGMYRIHVAAGVGAGACAEAWQALAASFGAEGSLTGEMELATPATLKVSFDAPALAGDLCSPSSPGGYLGAENQAIRVQMIDQNNYTWGFDNGAPLYRARVQDDQVTMLTVPKDSAHWPLAGQVVEILAWGAALPNGARLAEQSGYLRTVTVSYDPVSGKFGIGGELLGDLNTNAKARPDSGTFWDSANGDDDYLYLRIWNRGDDLASPPAIPLPNGPADPNGLLGHTGLRIAFNNGPLRQNDYWVISARPGAQEQLVPWELGSFGGRGAHGPTRYRAPLGLLEWHSNAGEVEAKLLHDCRPSFLPLTQQGSCCTIIVGDGSSSFGHTTSINAALAALPPSGGCVCVLPGVYSEAVVISKLHNVTLHGCGPRSRIVAPVASGAPAILIVDSHDVVIEELALEGGLVAVLEARNSSFLRIERNLVQVRDAPNETNPWPALFISGDDIAIDGNIIEILPEGETVQLEARERVFHRPGAPTRFVQAVRATGGIQLAGGCERVQVRDNCISGGMGHGITLGSLIALLPDGPREMPDIPILSPCWPCEPFGGILLFLNLDEVIYKPSAPLYQIDICDNTIYRHGANGIGVVRYFGPETAAASGGGAIDPGVDLVAVHGLSIVGNHITQCLRRTVAPTDAALQMYVGYGGIALAMCSQLSVIDNDIVDNGRDWNTPVCGVFVLVADGLRIERNRILNNGRREATPAGAQPGMRAGVHVWLAYASAAAGQASGAPQCAQLRIHDNQVAQPLGRALFLLGAGPMSIANNHLLSEGALPRASDTLAATVFVGNIGVSREWTLQLLGVMAIKLLAAINNVSAAQADEVCRLANDLSASVVPATVLPTGKLLFNNNQVSFQMPDGPNLVLISSCLLLSLDDVSANDNQFEFHGGKIKPVADLIALGGSVRVNGNRLAETWGSTQLSALVLGMLVTATSNQSTHCIETRGMQEAIRDNLLLAGLFCADPCNKHVLNQLIKAFAASGSATTHDRH